MSLFQKIKGKQLLLVDDDEWIRNALKLFFETEGCPMAACETAEEALALVHQQVFDIFIVDYRLPDMDGLAFLKRIQETCPHALKILISAYGSDVVAAEAKKCGVYECIKKPFDSAALEAVLARGLDAADSRHR